MRIYKPRHPVRLAACLVVLALLALSAYQLQSWANTPVQQSISAPSAHDSTTSQPKPQTIRTAYFSLEVPADFRIQETSAQDSPRITIQAFETSTGGQQAGITSAPLPTGGLANVGDYSFRANTPERYKRLGDGGLPANSVAFTSIADTPEMTIFLTRADRYAVLGLSGGATTDLQSLSSHG